MIFKHRTPLSKIMPEEKYRWPILVLGACVFLCYYCDRTNILAKEQKATSAAQFFICMGLVVAGSLFTLKTADKDLGFLNRDQSDEWKGWMQVAILVYHYVGASKVQYIYGYIRVAVSSYLFMTGFGHTVYFLKKDDFSFKRFVATMLRLNLLNVILAYAMDNSWLVYYFAPLVTWNFFIIYGLMRIGRGYNKSASFVLLKIAVAAGLNTAFCRIWGVMEMCWLFPKVLFNMVGDMDEWRFRVVLDLYSIFPGMIAGLLFVNWSSYDLPKSSKWPIAWWLTVLASVVVMAAFTHLEVNLPSKAAYNSLNPYISWLPCCAFVILRNSTARLRRTHNALFAWIGRCSLETFLLQFHIWLAGDTTGLLAIVPRSRLLNAALSTVIFIWVSSQATTATGPVIEWIMGAQPKPSQSLPLAQSLPNPIQSNGEAVGSGVPVNAQATDIKVQHADLEKVAEIEPQNRFATIAGDLRVRVLGMLTLLVVLNWTY